MEERNAFSPGHSLADRKLALEIRELEERIETQKRAETHTDRERRREGAKFFIGIALAAVTILGGFATAWSTGASFLRQQAKTYDLQVDKDMIELVNQLRAPSNDERESSALLLSAYEKDAFPLLFWRLERANDSEAEVILSSLRLIAEKHRVRRKDVLAALLAWAPLVIKRELARPDVSLNPQPIRNFLLAVGEFADADPEAATKMLNETERLVGPKITTGKFDELQGYALKALIRRMRSQLEATRSRLKAARR